MKNALTVLFLLVFSMPVFSGEWTPVSSAEPQPAHIRLIHTGTDLTTVTFTLEGFYMKEVATPAGMAHVIKVDDMTPIQEKSAPDLPRMAFSVIIPDQAEMEVRFISTSYKDYPGISIAPSRGAISREFDPATIPYTYGPVYNTDQFYPGNIAGMREPHIIRDLRGQTILINPFQYNPVTRVLRVYSEITVEIVPTGNNGANPLPAGLAVKQILREHQPLLSSHFINFDAMNYTPVEEYGNVLVICHGPFMEAMQPWVNWKRASGYPVEMINKDSVGTTAASIKAYIANYYNTKGLAHVLLVGDKPQIPTNTGGDLGGASDNAYGYIVGNDHYSDVYIGRFSAENIAHVQTQVQRTLDYEMNPQNLADDWFTTVIGIASDQGPGDDGEMDYQHIRNQQTKLLAYTYTANPELFDGSQGGNDAPGNPTPPMVSTEVNAGAGLILYTGHGSNNAWSTSGFSNTNVNQLTNAGKLPFIWSVACVNGNFTSGTCFAEAWLRATNGGQPTGAVAFLGSTINQSWDSPMEGQDEMTNVLIENNPGNIKRTFAGLSISGCMKMIDSYGLDGRNMADTWTVFGDPTVMVRTSSPQALMVAHDTVLFTGDSVLLLTCPVAGARATLTVAGSIFATGLFQNDTLMLAFSPLNIPDDTLHLVVTAYNAIPYQYNIPVDEAIILPVVAGFLVSSPSVIPGNSVIFADTSAGTVISREWIFPGGTPATSVEKNPEVTYAERGVYDVQLIVSNGLMTDTLTKTAYIVCDFPATSSTQEPVTQAAITPNPSDGNFVIRISSSVNDIATLKVTDLTGKIVYEESDLRISGNFRKEVRLSGLTAGIYLVKVRGIQINATGKAVIR